MPKLKVSTNGRYLQYEDGTRFFWLGDTAWELFHRLNREEAAHYLQNRANKGFTVIQAVVLAELEFSQPNPYGDLPLIDHDPARINEGYFRHVDYIVDRAAQLGLFVGMLPTWGDKFNRKWGAGPEIFTPANARIYTETLAQRYKEKPIIWILGGDRCPEAEEHWQIIRAMAEGIRAVVGRSQLITYHPMGGVSSSQYFHEDDWLDLNLFQSGHWSLNIPNYEMTERDAKRSPQKPVLDGEPCYEDHPLRMNPANGWLTEFDSRRAGYWSMLAGACGHTYGHHSIWQMYQAGRPPISSARTPWQQALDYPGAFQAGVMRRLFEQRPWYQLEPKQELIASGPSTAGKEVRAAAAHDGSFALVYTPYGSPFELSLNLLGADEFQVWWFNPRDGYSIDGGRILNTRNATPFKPPFDEARGNDWVLVLDDAQHLRERPGKAV